MDIDNELVAPDVPHYTQRRPVIRGTFNISRASIPYFQTSITLEEAARELSLVENLPSDLRSKWRLEELFQREIDWRRVKDEIVNGYLRRPEKLQFFNALTVALLPMDENRLLATEYTAGSDPSDIPDKYRQTPWRVLQVGGVEIIVADGAPHAYLRWDPKRIFPATIDGQHRLAALRMLVESGNLTSRNLATSLPVIFLVLDRRAGLEIGSSSYEDQNPILGIVREIFIDLNKSARSVTRARQILLDDQEIESRCVRELIAPRVGERTADRLPLGLVHWQHKVSAKFNAGDQTGPFITTIELLHAIVRDVLDIKPPRDPNEEIHIRKFVDSVEEALGVSEIIAKHPARYPELPPLMSYVERNYLKEGFEQPLANLPGPYLRACNDGFNERWRKPIVEVLTKFKPYADFIAEVDRRGGIDGDIGFFMCLPRRAQEQQVKDWGEDRYEKLDRPLRALHEMKQSDWAFFAVFQKGLLSATTTAWAHAAVRAGLNESEQDAFISRWLEFLHAMWNRGVFVVKAPLGGADNSLLWWGISLNPGANTVKWNNVTVDRISGLLLLWWYLYTSEMQRLGSFLKGIGAARGQEKFPGAKKAIESLSKGLQSAVRAPDEELNEAELERRAQERLKAVLALGRHEFKKGELVEDDEDVDADADAALAHLSTMGSSEQSDQGTSPDRGTPNSD